MKSTGILKRIDELGRIVIPKEIRKHLRIREGESLEIFINNDSIILKKHSMLEEISSIAQKCIMSFSELVNANIVITNRDKIIAASSSVKKKYLNKEISDDLCNLILERRSVIYQDKETINIIKGETERNNYIAVPIMDNGDPIGLVLILSVEDNKAKEIEKLAFFIAAFLGKYIE